MSLGLASLTRLSIDSSYWTVIFPSFIFVGAGVSMTMPTTTGRRDGLGRSGPRGHRLRRRQLVAAGRRRARRRGARLDRRDGRLAPLGDNAPAALQRVGRPARAARVGGQVARSAGSRPEARLAASHAFIDGVTTAMTVGSLLALTGAVIAFFGLRGFRPVNAPQGQAAPAVAARGLSPTLVTLARGCASTPAARLPGWTRPHICSACSGTSRFAPGSRRPSRRPSPGATRSS